MGTWQQLVSTALVGTERQAPVFDASVGAPISSQIDSADRENSLLTYAGVACLTRMAGSRSVQGAEDQIAAAEPEAAPRCGRLAAGMLAGLFAHPNEDQILEWLSIARQKGLRLPPELIPDALEYARKHAGSRPAVLAVAGNRGAWLARQNSEWSWSDAAHGLGLDAADDGKVATLWETGSSVERAALLAELRARDAEAARKLVESTWDADSPEDRATFLTTLRNGLSLNDEPLLERALDDKRKEIRRAAVELLWALPGSAAIRRMVGRADKLLSLKRSFLGGEALEVSLPDKWDEQLGRDGIEAKPPRRSGYGERAWLLRQIIGAIPPGHWSRALGRSPAQLIQSAAKNGDWKDLLLSAWTEASNRHHAAEWAEALMRFVLEQPKQALMEGKQPILPNLEALPEARLEDIIRLILEAEAPDRWHLPFELLNSRSSSWSATLARIIVPALLMDIRSYHSGSVQWWNAGQMLDLASRRTPPSLYDEIESLWSSGGKPRDAAGGRKVDASLDRLRFRWKMHRALDEEDR